MPRRGPTGSVLTSRGAAGSAGASWVAAKAWKGAPRLLIGPPRRACPGCRQIGRERNCGAPLDIALMTGRQGWSGGAWVCFLKASSSFMLDILFILSTDKFVHDHQRAHRGLWRRCRPGCPARLPAARGGDVALQRRRPGQVPLDGLSTRPEARHRDHYGRAERPGPTAAATHRLVARRSSAAANAGFGMGSARSAGTLCTVAKPRATTASPSATPLTPGPTLLTRPTPS